MDGIAHPAAIPKHCCRKGEQQVGAGKGWRHVWSCPQLWECPKAIAVSLTTPARPPQAPSWLRPSPNPFTKGSRTSPPLPWDIGAGVSRSPIPIWAPPGLGDSAAAQALTSARRLESLTRAASGCGHLPKYLGWGIWKEFSQSVVWKNKQICAHFTATCLWKPPQGSSPHF